MGVKRRHAIFNCVRLSWINTYTHSVVQWLWNGSWALLLHTQHRNFSWVYVGAVCGVPGREVVLGALNGEPSLFAIPCTPNHLEIQHAGWVKLTRSWTFYKYTRKENSMPETDSIKSLYCTDKCPDRTYTTHVSIEAATAHSSAWYRQEKSQWT